MSEFLMSNYSQIASNTRSMSFGAHQLVSEPLDSAIDSSRGRSSSHGGSGGGSPGGRRVPAAEERISSLEEPLAPVAEGNREGSSGHGDSGGITGEVGLPSQIYEDRILSIEDTLGALSGTVLDLNGRFEKFEGKIDKFEQLVEELVRSKRQTEATSLSPPLQYTMVAQNLFPNVQANSNNTWEVSPGGFNSSFPTQTFDRTPFRHYSAEQTPVVHTKLHQYQRAPSMGSMTSGHEAMLMSLHMEPEERIRILMSAAQKYKGDSKSPEERLQILTAAVQKYKVNKDSKSIEEQLPKPSDELLHVSSTIPSSNKVHKESSSVNYPPTAVPTKEVEARPIRAMKPSVSSVVRVAVQSIASDLPKLVEGLKDLQDDFVTKVQNYFPSHDSSDHFVADGTVLGEHVSSSLPVINIVTCAKQSEVPKLVQLHSKPATKKWVAENIGCATCKRRLLFVLIWDPGISTITLGKTWEKLQLAAKVIGVIKLRRGSTVQVTKNMIVNEGFSFLYKGVSAGLLRHAPARHVKPSPSMVVNALVAAASAWRAVKGYCQYSLQFTMVLSLLLSPGPPLT